MEKIPDVMVAAKSVYELLLENDTVRVMEVRLKPGQVAAMHNHPSPHVVYVKTDSKLQFTFPDGRTQVLDQKAGQVLWLEAGPHEAQNVGQTDFDNLIIEIKK
jgi:quercetin dioxygenase-like cupin family protein